MPQIFFKVYGPALNILPPRRGKNQNLTRTTTLPLKAFVDLAQSIQATLFGLLPRKHTNP